MGSMWGLVWGRFGAEPVAPRWLHSAHPLIAQDGSGVVQKLKADKVERFDILAARREDGSDAHGVYDLLTAPLCVNNTSHENLAWVIRLGRAYAGCERGPVALSFGEICGWAKAS